MSNVSTEGSAFMNVNSFHTRKGGMCSRARWKVRTFDIKEVERKKLDVAKEDSCCRRSTHYHLIFYQ